MIFTDLSQECKMVSDREEMQYKWASLQQENPEGNLKKQSTTNQHTANGIPK